MNDKEIFLKHIAPTSKHPVGLAIDRAEGSIITDTNGKQYIDLIAGIAVASLGHQNEAVNEAIKAQLEKHAHVMVYGEYIQKPITDLAYSLAQLLPETLGCSYFVNSGAEANEGAVKLAKRITGRYEIVSFRKSYHGNTMGAMSVSGNELKKQSYRPLIPGTKFINFNVASELEKITTKTAAVIVEPIQGDAGVIIPDQAFMLALRARCNGVGTLLIFDEVQTGIGRTGKMFAFEHFDIVPDILALAKGLGGGMPIGAFISSHANMQHLTEDPMLGHITTFGGNPVCCAAANAVVNTVKEPAFLQEVESKGQLFEELLLHPEIKAIRRKGLMIAVELENEDKVNKAIELALADGVIIYWFLSTRNAFRISPPLIIEPAEIRKACNIILSVFDKV
jgi:acetylornithine/N-succinyldiaminopimelate aminotransferase